MYFLAWFTASLYYVHVLESWGLDQPDLGVFLAEGEEVSLIYGSDTERQLHSPLQWGHACSCLIALEA